MIMAGTANKPMTVEAIANWAFFAARINGTASNAKRKQIEAREIKIDLERLCPKRMGKNMAIRKKLRALNKVPKINPFARA